MTAGPQTRGRRAAHHGGSTLNSETDCLILIDRLRHRTTTPAHQRLQASAAAASDDARANEDGDQEGGMMINEGHHPFSTKNGIDRYSFRRTFVTLSRGRYL